MTMCDTKSGREKQGRNKRRQLIDRLTEQELETLDEDEELPRIDAADSEFLADPDEVEEIDTVW